MTEKTRSADMDENDDDVSQANEARPSSDEAKTREREMEESGEENAA